MNSGISNKIIFFSFFFFNFIQPTKSADFYKVNKNENNDFTPRIWLKKSNRYKYFSSKLISNNNFDKVSTEKKKYEDKTTEPQLINIKKKQEELVIQSDKQSEINDILYAEGNVSIVYKGKFLQADNLIYDKNNKKISAKGNVAFILGEQVFEASQLEYSFVSEKGYLLDVKGSIRTTTLIDDLSSNFSLSDSNKLEKLLDLSRKRVLNTPNKVDNWLFLADKMTIEGRKWKSKRAVFSNDLLEIKQVKLAVNSLEVISEADKLRFKSSLNYLIFDEKVSIPFWFGERTLTKSEEYLNFENRWNLGYENLDKDGYFIGRKFNSVNLSDEFVLDLEPQFLIQRLQKGYTKSFVKKGDSTTSEKVKRDASFKDYFALKSQLKGRVKNWDLEVENNLNSFDVDKFPDAFRSKTNLNKEIIFFNTKWDKTFYGIYRDRVWNGSLGEAEVYLGYGSKLQKENTWVVNGIKKRELLSLGLANIKGEALNTKNLVTNLKGNLFYSLDKKFPINIVNPKNKSIDTSYSYIPAPITQGLSLNKRLEVSYSFYENGDHQEYLGLGIGPELILGNFKDKTFDYTRIAFFPFYKFKSGESAFKFDHNYEKFTLNISFDQQLFGPIIIKSIGTLNLSNDSDDYGEFIDSRISLNWKKRSYEFGIFYQPHNQSGGISFKLFGFR